MNTHMTNNIYYYIIFLQQHKTIKKHVFLCSKQYFEYRAKVNFTTHKCFCFFVFTYVKQFENNWLQTYDRWHFRCLFGNSISNMF